jgi:pimeloyl-ACP methyl ester carboxylesterase/DNA-binding CsgD family transcriptional regulator
MSHLEHDWANPGMRSFWETMAARYRVIRYDKRGTGLSDRNVVDFTFEAQLGDLEAVVAAQHDPAVALFGYSQGGPLCIGYAADHPDVVSHLILYGTYASGRYVAISELARTLIRLIQVDWGGIGSLSMADIYMPGASTENRQRFAQYQQLCADKDAAAAQAASVGEFSARERLKEIQAPTLVLHKRGDKAVPFELGRRLAADIRNSRFVPLEGDSHIITIGSVKETLDAMLEFLPQPGEIAAHHTADGITRREAEVLRLIADGRSNTAIARALGISVNTVDRHVSNVYTKIGAANRAEAAAYAVRTGLAS